MDRLSANGWRKTALVFMDDSTTASSPRVLAYLQERTRLWTQPWRITRASIELGPVGLDGEPRLVVLASLVENAPLNLRMRCRDFTVIVY